MKESLVFLHFQGFFKLYNARYSQAFLKKITFVHDLFKLHINSKSKERLHLFQRFAFYNDLIVKFAVFLYSGALLLMFLYPICAYIFEGKRALPFFVFVPGIDHTTVKGYVPILVMHLILVVLGCLGMAGCDIFYSVLIANVPIMARLLQDEVNALNVNLKQSAKGKNKWKRRFRNIILMHQETIM